MTDERECKKCLIVKPMADFHRNKPSEGGRLLECKECINKRSSSVNRNYGDRIEYKRLYRKENKQKYLAHKAVNRAVASGKLIRMPCVVCGETERIEGHHTDYSKPLKVIWLCRKHHEEWHCAHPPVLCEKLPLNDRPAIILNSEAVKVIKYAMKYMGYSTNRLAKIYNVCQGTISAIRTGRTWKDVKI